MASSFTSNLTLEKPGAGEQSNAWGNTLNTNFDAIDTAISLKRAGSPQGNVAASFVGQTCVDTSNKVIYIATTAGNASNAVWTPANVADASVTLTGDVTGTANFSGGNVSVATSYAVNPVPSGTITMFGGANAPTGYLLCNGASVSRSTYADLFTIIGTTYGSVSGTHFNVPNLSQKFPQGKDSSTTLGATGGNASVTPSGTVSSFTPTGSVSVTGNTGSHTLTVGEIPSHDHYLFANHSMNGNAGTHWVRRFGSSSDSSGVEKSASLEYYQSSGSDDFKYSIGFDSSNAAPTVHPSSDTGGGQGHNHSLSASATFSGNNVAPTFTGSSLNITNPFVIVNYIIKT